MKSSSDQSTDREEKESALIRRLLDAYRVAIVGLSDDPSRPSFAIAQYLMSVGKEVIPVNPNCQSVQKIKCYPTLVAVPGAIELVNVFRRPEHCLEVVRSAIAVGAKGIWLQSGIVSRDAQQLAAEAKIDFIQNRCIMVEHMRQR